MNRVLGTGMLLGADGLWLGGQRQWVLPHVWLWDEFILSRSSSKSGLPHLAAHS